MKNVKIAIVGRHGFNLSDAGVGLYAKLKGLVLVCLKERAFGAPNLYTVWRHESGDEFRPDLIERDDPALIDVLEQWGESAVDAPSAIKIVEVPEGTRWEVRRNFDNSEFVVDLDHVWE